MPGEKSNRSSVDTWLLPLLLLVFTGLAVTFLQGIFNVTVRWTVVAFAGVLAFSKGCLFSPLKHGLGQWGMVCGVWALLTYFWSEMPSLTLMKAGAFFIVSLSCLAVGQAWACEKSFSEMFNYLIPLTIVVLAAGVLGRGATGTTIQAGPTTMYRGLVDGPNMFGSMLSMATPLLTWKLYLEWNRPQKRILWLAPSILIFYFLVLAASRSAFSVALFTLAGLVISVPQSTRKKIVTITCLGAIAIALLVQGFVGGARDFVYKNATQKQGILHTREQIWKDSFEQSMKGGLIGGGYGVTIGAMQKFSGGFTAVGYGREKGNTQLAILEEMGVIGLVLYLVLLANLFAALFKAHRRERCGELKVCLGVITGALGGMTFLSIFEAWWVAPGSPEAGVFWATAGVALGLLDRSTNHGARPEIETRQG